MPDGGVGYARPVFKYALMVATLLLCIPYALAWVPIVRVSTESDASFAVWPVVVVSDGDPCAEVHEVFHAREAAETGVIAWYVEYGIEWLNAAGDPWEMPQEQRAVAAEPAGCARQDFLADRE